MHPTGGGEALFDSAPDPSVLRGRRQVVVDLKREWIRWWGRTQAMERLARTEVERAYFRGRAEMLTEIKSYLCTVSEECLVEAELQLVATQDEAR